MLASPAGYEAARAQVEALARSGDSETQNALVAVVDAMAEMRDASPGSEAVTASRSFIDSLRNLATQCQAAGSSALQ